MCAVNVLQICIIRAAHCSCAASLMPGIFSLQLQVILLCFEYMYHFTASTIIHLAVTILLSCYV